MARAPRKATPQSLENAALFYQQRFASSAVNLRGVLMRRVERSVRFHGTDRDEGRAAVDALVDRFQASGLLDDGAYAESRAVTLHRRGVPARGIRARLVEKGVASDHIEAALIGLAETGVNSDWAAAVNLARRRRLGPYHPFPAREDMREKDLAALAGLTETGENTDFAAAVNLARRRRLGAYRSCSGRAEMREKDLAALARAGFSYDTARRIVEAETPEDLEPSD